MTDLSLETKLLRTALRWQLGEGKLAGDLAPLLAQVNWSHVLWLARQHRVLLLLHDALKRSETAGLCPPEIVDQLTAFHAVNQLRSLARAREVCQLQSLFDRHAIPAIGTDKWMAAHACTLRPDLIEPSTVLRYLIPVADLDRTTTMLAAAGHLSENDPEKLIKPGSSPVRLNGGLGKQAAAIRFWHNAILCEFGGRSHRRLAFGHWLLLRAASLESTEDFSLDDAHEVVLLSRQIAAAEWPTVLAEAAHFGLEHTASKTVAACHAALDLPAPAGLADNSGPNASAGGQTEKNRRPSPGKTLVAPFLPTPSVVAARMLKLAQIIPTDVVCDLGCGDGRIAIKAAKDFGARGLGVDRDPVRIAEANALSTVQGVNERATFTCGDLFATSLKDATIVTCYLLPQLQPLLHEKLMREARPGTRIVSHEFIFPGWPPEKTEIIRVGPLKVSQIYLWRIS